MTMPQSYEKLFAALDNYLSGFAEKGYDAPAAGELISQIGSGGNTPLDNILNVFGCGDFESCAVVLGVYASSCGKHRELLSRFGAGGAASVTPAAVSGLFFGCTDIMPFCGSLSEGSALSRLFDGASPYALAEMTLKGFIASYIFTGELYDPCFAADETEAGEYIPLRSTEAAADELISLITGLDPAQPAVIRVTGERGSGRHTAVRRAFEKAGRSSIFLMLPGQLPAERARELCTKLLLSGSIPVIFFCGGAYSPETAELISDELGLVVTVSGEPLPDTSAGSYTVRIGMPSPEEQLTLWQTMGRAYPIDPSADLAELTGEFELTPGAVKKALHFASLLSGEDTLSLRDIKNGCYRSFGSDMGSKAVKLSSSFAWEDLVLPEHSKQQLRAACDQVRLRHKVFEEWGFGRKMPYGRSVSMIFTGSPGTGKTMAAQIVAAELGMDIYRISLANVVSKYIGETEKNLNEIFDKARQSHVILFFDEADALFSRRTEVKDSNDKYSNMEAAFLLQKTEEFSGVVILATNLVQNFDEAFKRRMRFIIDFPFPDTQRRAELWKRAFPAGAPLGNIDFDFLVSHYELSGSNIRSIALHSAFLAASGEGEPVGMKHIMPALRNEYSKSGKAFGRAEAGEYYYCLSES